MMHTQTHRNMYTYLYIFIYLVNHICTDIPEGNKIWPVRTWYEIPVNLIIYCGMSNKGVTYNIQKNMKVINVFTLINEKYSYARIGLVTSKRIFNLCSVNLREKATALFVKGGGAKYSVWSVC